MQICSDGVGLKIVSDSGGSAIAVSKVYLKKPSSLYTPGSFVPGEDYGVPGVSQTYQIDHVTLNRELERSILKSQSKYDIGRVGAEIAYMVAEKNLHLDGIDMPEVSQGGVDLYTADGKAIMQARMLANPLDLGADLHATLAGQLFQMVGKLRTDFQYHDAATTSYAILSYRDPTTNVVKTIVAVVPRP
jgi:hypothetical protein